MINKEEKQESIYREFYPKVTSYICSHINNKSDVEDITSMVFVKIYSSLDKYNEEKATLSTWIYAITKNTVINHIKKQKFSFIPFEMLPNNCNTSENCETEDILERLNEEISKLPPVWQDIVILHYYFGLSHKEISEKIKHSYANTRKQCSMAIAELKRRLK